MALFSARSTVFGFFIKLRQCNVYSGNTWKSPNRIVRSYMNIVKASALSTAFFLSGCAFDNSVPSIAPSLLRRLEKATVACYKSHDDERPLLGSKHVWMACNRWADAKARRRESLKSLNFFKTRLAWRSSN